MPKHTSGPWYRVADQIFSDPQMTDEICVVTGGSGTQYIDEAANSECLANSLLIAAAPELLGSLDRMSQWAEFFSRNQGCHPSGPFHTDLGKAVAVMKTAGFHSSFTYFNEVANRLESEA